MLVSDRRAQPLRDSVVVVGTTALLFEQQLRVVVLLLGFERRDETAFVPDLLHRREVENRQDVVEGKL